MDWIDLPTTIALGLMIGGMALVVWAAAHRGAQKERACEEQQTEFTASMDRFGYVQDARNRGAPVMQHRTFIDTALVADLLDQTPEQFLRIRSDLEDTHGFPLPMPHWKRPLKWRADQVQGWIEAKGRPQSALPNRPMGHNIILLEEARRE